MTEAGEVSSAFYYVEPAGAMDHRYSILEAQRAPATPSSEIHGTGDQFEAGGSTPYGILLG